MKNCQENPDACVGDELARLLRDDNIAEQQHGKTFKFII